MFSVSEITHQHTIYFHTVSLAMNTEQGVSSHIQQPVLAAAAKSKTLAVQISLPHCDALIVQGVASGTTNVNENESVIEKMQGSGFLRVANLIPSRFPTCFLSSHSCSVKEVSRILKN